ncbi:MAG: HAD-IIIA family hydrolase [Planctomycetota bacterium]|nr:HAD-IIIA family hydrolase [Planctomycetota bacterium]
MTPPNASASSGVPAVFLDRDGTLIEDRGDLREPAEAVFFAETVPALRRLHEHFRLIIVTNQPGVSTGELTREEVDRVNAHVVQHLARAGVVITAVYFCPHQRSENCACIKPKPFFLQQAAREHNLDLRRSFVIGDHPHDIELARAAGSTGVYVLTGHGLSHRADLSADILVAKNIGEAADLVLELRRR